MIVGAAFVPAAPLLLPGLTGGGIATVTTLRDEARAAIAAVLDGGVERVVVVGAADRSGRIGADRPSPLAGFRGRASTAGALPLPVAHAVALTLLDDMSTSAELFGVEVSTPAEQCLGLGRELAADERRTALVVAGDGSARRSATAPGYLDPAAFALDDTVLDALRAGEPAALAALDAGDCARLLVSGRTAWQVLAGSVERRRVRPGPVGARDPYGVQYVTGHWWIG